MKTRRIIVAILAVLVCGISAYAQTAEEIVQKMEDQLSRADKEGFTMDLNMKMPIVGLIKSHSSVAGDKMKVEISGADKSSTLWQDATTKWEYNPETKEVTVTKNEMVKKDENSDLSTFSDVTEGYDLSLSKETADAWYIACKRSKTNKDKDAPKKMDLCVSKATNLPIYLKMKKSILEISMENITIGVSEKSVTFNPADYPDATIVDKR